MHKFEKNLKKAVGIGLTAGLSVASPSFAQNLENSNNDETPKKYFTQDKHMADQALQSFHRPADYDIAKTAKLDLKYLDEKKSFNKEVIDKIAFDLIIEKRIQSISGKRYSQSLSLNDAVDKKDKEKELEFLRLLKESSKEINLLKSMQGAIQENKFNYDELQITSEEHEFSLFISEMISTIENARQRATELLSSDQYLTRLQEEFNCSLEQAKKHQQVRLSNISKTNYRIMSRQEVQRIFEAENPEENNFTALAYDAKYNNLIYFSYDYNYEDYLPEISFHEFLHKATRRNLGLSPKAIELLKESFSSDTNIKEVYNIYNSIPTERYVRLKILDDKLEKLGIKKVGEKFTRKHFDQLYKLYTNSKLKLGALEFMHFTDLPNKEEYEDFDKYLDDLYKLYERLFNELAENAKYFKNTYYHANWDYNNQEKKS